MKKILSLSLFVALAIGFVGCKKNNPNASGKNSLGVNTTTSTPVVPVVVELPVGAVPQTFTKKTILEEFTGEWCGYCPDGASIMESIGTSHPDKFYGVAVHQGDFMENASFFSFMDTYYGGISSFPSGSVARGTVESRGSWAGLVSSELAKPAELGLSLVCKESNDNLNISVYVGHNKAISGTTKLTIYILENGIDQVSQSNGGPGYIHQHVFRKVITANVGDDININDTKKHLLKEYKNIDIAGLYKKKANLKVLAFVNVEGSGKTVMNAQESGLNETKKWD